MATPQTALWTRARKRGLASYVAGASAAVDRRSRVRSARAAAHRAAQRPRHLRRVAVPRRCRASLRCRSCAAGSCRHPGRAGRAAMRRRGRASACCRGRRPAGHIRRPSRAAVRRRNRVAGRRRRARSPGDGFP